ncbi:hypothetical protein VTJ49DRAFT_5849 [Mycothermus thermophilus]|uniref:WSC domain-containing protein n=1 Tax=Humicola insolens TaxID=85995 RepID=A0ABR3V2K7_HUMIN
MAAAALVARVRATEVFLPPCLDPFQPFVYSGCFAEAQGTQILPYRSPATPDDMTVEKCVAECKGNGYRYAGLVYYGVCYCGQTQDSVDGSTMTTEKCLDACRAGNFPFAGTEYGGECCAPCTTTTVIPPTCEYKCGNRAPRAAARTTSGARSRPRVATSP